MAEVLLLVWATVATVAWWEARSDARWHAARAAGYKAWQDWARYEVKRSDGD